MVFVLLQERISKKYLFAVYRGWRTLTTLMLNALLTPTSVQKKTPSVSTDKFVSSALSADIFFVQNNPAADGSKI